MRLLTLQKLMWHTQFNTHKTAIQICKTEIVISHPVCFFGTEISNTSLIRKNSNSSATKKVSNIESKQIMT